MWDRAVTSNANRNIDFFIKDVDLIKYLPVENRCKGTTILLIVKSQARPYRNILVFRGYVGTIS